MSTSYDVICLDCPEASGLNPHQTWDGQRAGVVELANAAPRLSAIAALAADLPSGVTIASGRFCDDCESFSIAWFGTHAGHRIVACNEWGDYFGPDGKPAGRWQP